MTYLVNGEQTTGRWDQLRVPFRTYLVCRSVCCILGGGFLLQNKHYILASTLLLWGGVSVALSRIYLAMHSYTDLFVACAFVVLFGLVIPILQKLLAPLERAIERLQHSSQLKNC